MMVIGVDLEMCIARVGKGCPTGTTIDSQISEKI